MGINESIAECRSIFSDVNLSLEATHKGIIKIISKAEGNPDIQLSLIINYIRNQFSKTRIPLLKAPEEWNKRLLANDRDLSVFRLVNNIDFCPQLEWIPSFDGSIHLVFRPQETLEFPERLTKSPELNNLEILRTTLNDEDLIELVKSEYLIKLRELTIYHQRAIAMPNGIMALAKSKKMEQLEKLHLSGIYLDLETIKALATSPYTQKIRHLELQACNVNDEMLGILLNSPIVENLETLALNDNSLTNTGIAKLANTKTLSNLKRLEFDSNQVQSTGLVAIATSPYLKNLEILSVWGNKIGHNGINAILESTNHLPKLSTLNISYMDQEIPYEQEDTPFTYDDLIALITNPNLKITELDISNNDLDLLGPISAITEPLDPNINPRLTTLNINNTQLGPLNSSEFINILGKTNIKKLHLDETLIDVICIPNIIRNCPNLTHLSLIDTQLEDSHIQQLTESCLAITLQHLDCRFNNLTDDQAHKLKDAFGDRVSL